MRWVLTDPRGVSPALEGKWPSLEHYAEPLPRRLSAIADAPPLAPESRLDIYAEGYHTRIVESLTADFPTLAAELGEERFSLLVAEYLVAHPSRATTTSEIGVHLPVFLDEHRFTEEKPHLADLARFEWLFMESFLADDLPAFDPSALAQVGPDEWGRLAMTLDSSVRLLASRWNVGEVWRMNGAKAVEQDAFHLIYRENAEVWVEDVGPVAFRIVEAMRRGLTLGALVAELPGELERDAEEIQSTFQARFADWVKCGVIRGIHII